MGQTVFFTMWLPWPDSILSLVDTVGEFITDTGLSNEYQGIKYFFTGLLTHDNKYVPINLRNQEQARIEIQERLEQSDIARISFSTSGEWRDSFILNENIYRNWGIDAYFYFPRPKSHLYSVQLIFHETSLWFAPKELAEKFYDKDFIIKSYKQSGWKLKVSSETLPSALAQYGNLYIPEERLCQENRTKLITGISKLIQQFAPEAAALTYWGSAEYSSEQKLLTCRKEYGCIMYYLEFEDTATSAEGLLHFPSPPIRKRIGNIELFLAKDHFGFLP